MDLLAYAAVPLVAYLMVVAFVAFDAMIPAVPGEVVVISAGALAATGHLEVSWVVAAAALGAIAGDLTVYSISRSSLPGALDRSRIGRRIRTRINRAHAKMGSTSAAAIIAARFIPFGRTTAAAGAGLVGITPRRFVSLSLVGCVLWAAWTVGLGFVTGNVGGIGLWLQIAIGTAIGVLVGIWAGAVRTIAWTRRRLSGRAISAAELVSTTGPATAQPVTGGAVDLLRREADTPAACAMDRTGNTSGSTGVPVPGGRDTTGDTAVPATRGVDADNGPVGTSGCCTTARPSPAPELIG